MRALNIIALTAFLHGCSDKLEPIDVEAEKIFDRVYQGISLQKQDIDGRPALVYVTDVHRTNAVLDQEPPYQPLFAQIAAISAAQKHGLPVVLSIEYPEHSLESFIDESIDSAVPLSQKFSLLFTMKYALEQGIEVVGVDPLSFEYGLVDGTDLAEPREQAIRQELSKLALKYSDSIVVHIDGLSHISDFQGYANGQMIDYAQTGVLPAPFHEGVSSAFSSQFFINSDFWGEIEREQISSQVVEIVSQSNVTPPEAENYNDIYLLALKGLNLLGEREFVENPAVALQINPPGNVDGASPKDIVEAIVSAAERYEPKAEITYSSGGIFNLDLP